MWLQGWEGSNIWAVSWYRDPGSAIFGATEGKVGLLSLAWASKFDSSIVSNFYYHSKSILTTH